MKQYLLTRKDSSSTRVSLSAFRGARCKRHVVLAVAADAQELHLCHVLGTTHDLYK